MLRAHQLRCAAMIGGYSRTAEAQALVRSRWAHDLVAPRPVVRARAPRVVALEDSGFAQERDPASHTRTAAVDGAATPRARRLTPGGPCSSRCRGGATFPRWPAGSAAPSPGAGIAPGPLSLPDRDASGAVCRWCGRERAGAALRAMRFRRGARRRRRRAPHRRGTRPGVSRHHRGHLRGRRDGRRRFPATPPSSSPPRVPNQWRRAATAPRCSSTGGRCSAAQDLRAAEDALRRWMAAAALVRSRDDGGVVAVVAESAIPTVQALIRWDPVGHAEAELDARDEVGLPPARAHGGRRRRSRSRGRTAGDGAAARRRGASRPRRPAVGSPQAARRHRRGPGQPDAGPGAPRRAASRWPRRCAGPPVYSAPGTISSPFVCRSTRCT